MNPNTDRDERVSQIRERQKTRSHVLFAAGRVPISDDVYADTEYVLSLLDSQASEHERLLGRIRDEIRQRERDCADEIERLESDTNDASTRMRDHCVERVIDFFGGLTSMQVNRDELVAVIEAAAATPADNDAEGGD